MPNRSMVLAKFKQECVICCKKYDILRKFPYKVLATKSTHQIHYGCILNYVTLSGFLWAKFLARVDFFRSHERKWKHTQRGITQREFTLFDTNLPKSTSGRKTSPARSEEYKSTLFSQQVNPLWFEGLFGALIALIIQ